MVCFLARGDHGLVGWKAGRGLMGALDSLSDWIPTYLFLGALVLAPSVAIAQPSGGTPSVRTSSAAGALASDPTSISAPGATGECVPNNRTGRVFAEIGGYYLGALPVFIPLLVMNANHEFRGDFGGFGLLLVGVPTVVTATFTGALGAWGFGRLLGGDGGYGWTWLGGFLATATILPPIYTFGLASAGSASLGFELSTSRTCVENEGSRHAMSSQWFLAPTVEPTGSATRYGLSLAFVL